MCAAVYRERHLVKATEVTAGLAESNGSLLPGLWRDSLHVTCGLTACTPGSAPGPTLGNQYGKTLPLPPAMRPFVEILWPLVTCTVESVAGVAGHADTAETAVRVGTIGVHVAVSAVFGTLVQI